MKRHEIKNVMKEVLLYCNDVDYCDVRFVDIKSNSISYRNSVVENDLFERDKGIAIRLMKNGSWGFACSADLRLSSLKITADKAKKLASLGMNANQEKHFLSKKNVFVDQWFYPEQKTLWEENLKYIHQELKTSCDLIKNYESCIKVATSRFHYKKTHWMYLDSEGSDLVQSWSHCGGGLTSTAVKNGEMQKRTYHNRGGLPGGLENFDSLKLLDHSERIADESIRLLNAKTIDKAKRDIIIGTDQLALQIHESVGHPNELDRVLGWEANFAGTSFNDPKNKNKLQYGSSMVNLVADNKMPSGLATRAYDDDGVPAQRFYVVKDGIFQDYYSSRDTANYLKEGGQSTGCNRADSWSSVPITRIPNVSLMPGEDSLEELISGIEDGLFIDFNKSWSIDQRRDQFQFGVEVAYEIKDGKLKDLVKNVEYSGRTIEFWNSCDGVANEDYYQPMGEIHCGKGQPMQTIEMTHGCAPARFRGVETKSA